MDKVEVEARSSFGATWESCAVTVIQIDPCKFVHVHSQAKASRSVNAVRE
jgi:hypothetical protein